MDAVYLKQLRLLLDDPIVRSQLTVDGVTAGRIDIEENGDVTLGRSSKGWVNLLFQSRFRLSFFEIATKIAGIYIGKINDEQMVGVLREIYDNCIRENKREAIVDLLFMYAKLFVQESIIKSPYLSMAHRDGTFPKDPRLRRKYSGSIDRVINLGGQYMPITLVGEFYEE